MKTIHKIDYKRELESASKSMIMIHEPKLLIKLILRMIVHKVRIKHAAMLLYDPGRDTYILNISRGESGAKIPTNFVRFDRKHPIIKLFLEKEYRPLTLNRSAILSHDLNKLIWQESVFDNGNGKHIKELLHQVGEQMDMFGVVACVPAYYHRKLLAVLMLGGKQDEAKFDQGELDFFAALASDVAMAIRNAQLFEGMKKEAEKNHDLFIRTTIVLGAAIEAKDKYTLGHTQGVTDYAKLIARQMEANGSAKFEESFYESLYIAGMLHDVGKIGVPEAILNKNGSLTEEEYTIIKRHPLHGVEILKPLSELKDSIDAVKHHHERYDGKGYPEGLKGDQIPIIAAIIGVADSYDAMTTDRPYRKRMKKEEAIQEIRRHTGSQFHPKVARALVELYDLGHI